MKIFVMFEKGDKGFIAKETSDGKAWVVPKHRAKHQSQPAIGSFLVEITGQTANERLRFCRVLASLPELVDNFINTGKADEIEISPAGWVAITKIVAANGVHYIDRLYVTLECKERNGAAFTAKFRVYPTWGGSRRNDFGAPLLVQELPADSTLHREIATVRAAFEQAEQDKQRAVAERTREAQKLTAHAATDPDDEFFAPLQTIIKQAREREQMDGSSIWPTDEELGYFAKFSVEELSGIVYALSGTIVRASYSWSSRGGGGKYLYCVPSAKYLEEQKTLLLREHPSFGIAPDDPKFWDEAVRKYGEYVGYSEKHLGYGQYQDEYRYKLRIGDYFLWRTFAGGVDDEGPIYQ